MKRHASAHLITLCGCKIVGSITCVCAQELEDILDDTRKSFREVYELRNFAEGHTLGWS